MFGKLTQPLLKNIEWIKTEQNKAGKKMNEKEINDYVLNQTVEQLELIG